jgi:hypothetical protein
MLIGYARASTHDQIAGLEAQAGPASPKTSSPWFMPADHAGLRSMAGGNVEACPDSEKR